MVAASGEGKNSPLVVEIMLAQAANMKSDACVDLVDPTGSTALHYALYKIGEASPEKALRKAAIARKLILAGADVFATNKRNNRPTDYVPEAVGRRYSLPFSRVNSSMMGIGFQFKPTNG